MKHIGYRVFRLRKAIIMNEHVEDRGYQGCLMLDPSGLGGGGWANPDGTLSTLKTAEMISSKAMEESPEDEFVILAVYKARAADTAVDAT
jgi:hypothetical protein